MIEAILGNPWLAGLVVLITQIIFLYFRTLNVMYTSENKILPSVVTGTAIGFAWLITIAIGVNAMIDGEWQPIVAHAVGGILGTLWGFHSKEKQERKRGNILDLVLQEDYYIKGGMIKTEVDQVSLMVVRAPKDQHWRKFKRLFGSKHQLCYTVKKVK